MKIIDSSTYFQYLLEAFPVLLEEISSWDDDHSKMERFATYTIQQIKNSNFSELKKCFEFQESNIGLINQKIENAMTVSFCESLLLGEEGNQMPQFVQFMGPKLLKMYHDYETYYNELYRISKENRDNSK